MLAIDAAVKVDLLDSTRPAPQEQTIATRRGAEEQAGGEGAGRRAEELGAGVEDQFVVEERLVVGEVDGLERVVGQEAVDATAHQLQVHDCTADPRQEVPTVLPQMPHDDHALLARRVEVRTVDP
jgi:hypothetical protein